MKALYEISTLNIVKPRNQKWSDYNIKIPSSEILTKKGLAVIELASNAFQGYVLPKLEDVNGNLVVVEGYTPPEEPPVLEKSYDQNLADWINECIDYGKQLVQQYNVQSFKLNVDDATSDVMKVMFQPIINDLNLGHLNDAKLKIQALSVNTIFTQSDKDQYVLAIQDYLSMNPKPLES